jgi:Mg-chelatase subunit ChlD
LRRKPKVLEAPPALHGRGGHAIAPAGRPVGEVGNGQAARGWTDDSGAMRAGESGLPVADPVAVRRGAEIAARLALPRRTATRRGPGKLISAPWRGSSDDIDLDRTLEALTNAPSPRDQDVVIREFVRPRRAIVLLVDVSGSMRGERIRTAAATVGALASEFARDALTVVAFASDAVLLSASDERMPADRVLEEMLRIPARGLTNIAFPLQVARDRLAETGLPERRVLLLSDCVHNAGPDPRSWAARLPRLDVLVDTSDEHDLDLARDLARLGRGRVAKAHDHRQVAPAISRFFAG